MVWRKENLITLLVGMYISTATMENGMEIHSGTLAWKISWTEEPGSHRPWSRKELDTTERLHSLNQGFING